MIFLISVIISIVPREVVVPIPNYILVSPTLDLSSLISWTF
jgi:hypothetical protein